jgi:hypothetical protein
VRRVLIDLTVHRCSVPGISDQNAPYCYVATTGFWGIDSRPLRMGRTDNGRGCGEP